ncbi:Dabb family protein [Curtobacterium ammoniigenes]|uniref:Dabb family protein n=1 Tax=Curtobacterium ammoniigenes TaxID=395387 RepID=UPI0008359C43|nr:Dabb family protein [Curtobacterium ammoniigenes]
MITHVVIWTLRPEIEREAALDRITSLLTELDGVVESLRSIRTVRNIPDVEHNGDIAVIATFDDVDGLEAYQVHPRHQEAAAEIRSLVASRAAIDWAEIPTTE